MQRETYPEHELIAQFLKDNNYHQTLAEFEKEHGKPITRRLLNNSETLSHIIEDRLQYNSINEKLKNSCINEELPENLEKIAKTRFASWPSPCPRVPHLLRMQSLILSSCYDKHHEVVYFTTNDSHIFIKQGEDEELVKFKSPEIIRKVMVIDDDAGVVMLGMSGTLYLKESVTLVGISSIKTDFRFVVDAQYIKFNEKNYIVVLAWNGTVKLITLKQQEFQLVSEMKLSQQSTCFALTVYQNELILVLGKLESTLLEVYTLKGEAFSPSYKISINDAEFTVSSFMPRCMIISQSLPSSIDEVPLIAVATSHEPYMRIIIVSLEEFQNRKNCAFSISRLQIIRNSKTTSPQDKFSQPIISWRLGSRTQLEENQNRIFGLWIMGDDGVIRGLDVVDNKVVIELKETEGAKEEKEKKGHTGHNGRIKNFISYIDSNGEEILLSAGVDKRVILWRVD
ncbi:hypothetical protein KGF56_004453 [Candida oxycetoniae]|uniref:LisH domain-containing protein n=1 Tax=Candida oxycetoniae TaxID=497107 RepID=A0AAI9SU84_9ASCO|nr:uncharacterized protein KGF56_004453 [Candida oxycetoniae]KAI3402779.2 hypothetical protein KGF56_004453 [Candida oxycetoniae]